MARLEKDFQTEWTRSIHHYFKDKPYLYRKDPDLGQGSWFDCILIANEMVYGMELKITKNIKTINFKALFGYGKQEHEIHNLRKLQACGFYGFIVINHYVPKHRINDVYAIPPYLAMDYIESRPIDDLKQAAICIKVPQITVPYAGTTRKLWDVSVLF